MCVFDHAFVEHVIPILSLNFPRTFRSWAGSDFFPVLQLTGLRLRDVI